MRNRGLHPRSRDRPSAPSQRQWDGGCRRRRDAPGARDRSAGRRKGSGEATSARASASSTQYREANRKQLRSDPAYCCSAAIIGGTAMAFLGFVRRVLKGISTGSCRYTCSGGGGRATTPMQHPHSARSALFPWPKHQTVWSEPLLLKQCKSGRTRPNRAEQYQTVWADHLTGRPLLDSGLTCLRRTRYHCRCPLDNTLGQGYGTQVILRRQGFVEAGIPRRHRVLRQHDGFANGRG